MVGCELSLHLASKGISSTVVEMGPELAPDSVLQERTHTLYLMDQDPHIQSYTGMRCVEINSSGIIAEDPSGVKTTVVGDKVILAAGMRSLDKARDSFDGHAFDVIAVGDCKQVSNIHNAVSTGYSAALMI